MSTQAHFLPAGHAAAKPRGLPPSRNAELSAPQRHVLVGGIAALHLIGVFGLLQVRTVREAVSQAAPIFVAWIAPPAPPAMPAPAAAAPPRPAPPPRSRPAPRPAPSPHPAAAPEPPAPMLAAPAAAAVAAPETEPVATPADSAPPAVAPPQPAPPQPAPPQQALPRSIPDSAVQYLVPPQVVYPRLSMRHAESGRVVIRALIGTDGGAPRELQVQRSSGHARLDEAALAAVAKARFKPYAENGRPVEGWALIPIDFKLES